MSCDFAVWYPTQRLSNEEAEVFYELLCQTVPGLPANPAINAFHRDLIELHPEIDDVPEEKMDDFDFSPWSNAMDVYPGYMIHSCVWSKVDYVKELVSSLAKKHRLAFYDPKNKQVIYP